MSLKTFVVQEPHAGLHVLGGFNIYYGSISAPKKVLDGITVITGFDRQIIGALCLSIWRLVDFECVAFLPPSDVKILSGP